MKFKTAKKRNNGFTLVEMLAVTAIVVILLAVGMVAVVHYARWLRITELDNSAREIYLAAENRAVLLSAGGRLEAQVAQAGGDEDHKVTPPGKDKGATLLAAGGDVVQADEFRYIYYDGTAGGSGGGVVSDLTDLLPQGAIDPALRKGCFYIVYEVKAGSVADVFYAEETAELEDEGDFAQFYTDWRESSRQERLDNQKMFGYYGGEAARNGSSDALREPILEVINGEELLVRLTYEAPNPLPEGETRTPKVWLYYGENKKYGIELSEYKNVGTNEPGIGEYKEEKNQDLINGVTTYTLTWVLDTLKEGQQFKDLEFKAGPGYTTSGTPGSFGEDFTVEAWIEGSTVHSTTASDTGNSLFADETHDGDIAYIENLRHLQNLDEEHSEVAGKRAAVQTADIEQSTSELTYYKDYEFKPIENSDLKSYCGSHKVEEADPVTHFIKGLTVTVESAGGRNSGLFSTVKGDSEDKRWSFRDVRMINARVEAVEKSGDGTVVKSLPAGALVGKAENASFDGCWVYWEMDSQNELYGQLTNNGTLKYQITGSNTGGLAGELSGGSIRDCLAATLVDGADLAGGLVGQTTGKVTVDTSYADCYLTAPTAGGLIGTAGADGTVGFTDVYAAGFIDKAEKEAAGLCNGNSTVTASNAYSVMRYENTKTDVIKPLANGVQAGADSNCYYLHINSGDGGKEYEKMVRPEKAEDSDFAKTMGNSFTWKERAESHPYDLRKAGLKTYDFPGLKDLPHYGDWNTEFIKPALVYFEQYTTGNTPRFYGGGDEVSLRDDAVVSLDGYAVAFRAEDLPTEPFTITFSYQTKDGTLEKEGKKQQYTKGTATGSAIKLLEVKIGEEIRFYLAPLPNDLINSEYAADKFYQQLGFQVGSDTPTWAAYCPHFAKTEFPLEGTTPEERAKEIEDEWQSGRAYAVRTPRHLRALSQFEAYYSAERRYTFRQELDLDYKTYTGYDWDNSWDEGKKYTQEPIGRSDKPFNGVYDGGYHTIQGVRFTLPEGSSRQYAGLFGLSIDTLKNIVYLMEPDNKIPVATGTGLNLYLGGLAGGNSGTIDNCAVAGANLEGKVYSSATASAGGLVGHNMGTIQNSAADVKLLYTESSGYAHSLAGGLVGMNDSGATVTDSYAVGHVSAKVDSTSDARVCGFVGRNAGSVTSSYAAVWLESSGAGVETYGFCGEKMGSQQNTHFLNEGNFEYRTQPYNASYVIRSETKAKPIVYKELTSEKSPLLSQGSKMKLGGKAVYGPNLDADKDQDGNAIYPYPTGVTRIENGETVYVHYGQWPAELNLGEMGVYYWEKLSLPTGELDQDGKELRREVYGVSMLAVKPDKANDGTGTVSKLSTLSNARSDGGVVVDYGYGYYHHAENENVTFSVAGILYTKDGTAGSLWGSQQSDGTVDQELKELMPGYTFHSYHSFVPNPDPNEKKNFVEGTRAGLYATGAKGSAPNGTVTLTGKDNVTATFEVNPHFADALSISMVPDKYTVSDSNLEISPGTNEGNPYEVRAMGQLSAINWNSENRDTKTVLTSSNQTQFPYLSRSSDTGKYHWRQTHDLNGNGQTQTPIAEYYDSTSGEWGTLSGWFGGTYEGDDYVIENINIQGQASSCVGLFGMVFQGKLSNIVMYSSDGNGVISTIANGGADGKGVKTQSRWYAMGALAGMVGGSTIENCSAAGYEIDATVFTYSIGKDGWGGNNIGGLIGATDGGLSGCAAVTEISVHDATENDNMRVGGLVGVCQGTISNCYAGGSISFGGNVKVQRDNRFIYVGGLVGGSYMKPLKVADNVYVGIDPTNNNAKAKTSNELIDCYSYVTLPKRDAAGTKTNEMHNILALYALGGTGEINENGDWDKKFSYSNNGGVAENHGTCTITNCYYLESEVMKNNPEKLVGVAKTDLFDLTRNAVQVIVTDESGNIVRNTDNNHFIEEKMLLTAADVNKEFLISYNGVNTGYTYDDVFKLKIGNQTVNCPYYHHGIDSLHYASGVPIFEILDKTTPNNTTDCKWVVFRGWAVDLTVGSKESVQVTNEPTMFDDLDNSVTYDQLAGRKLITKDGVSKPIMTENGTNSWLTDFRPVTATEGKFDIPGKYSYSSDPKLEGLDYPFPTILTREGGTLHVHYGNWPLNGIERKENGGAPITLNLLGKKQFNETLSLSEGVKKGGTWAVVEVLPDGETQPIATPSIAQGTDNETRELSVTGNRVGQTTVRVTYTEPGVGGRSYSLDVTVYVTATLRVAPKPSPIYVYPGSLTKVPLVLCDEQGQELELTEELRENLLIHRMTAGNPPKQLQAVNIEKDETDDTYYLVLRAAGETPKDEAGNNDSTGLLTVAVDYRYGQDSGEEDVWDNYTSTLTIEMLELPVAKPGEDSVTTLTFPQVSLGKDASGKDITVDTMVKEVTVGNVTEPEPVEPGDPNAQPEAEPVREAVCKDNVVTLKNYTPGSDVTLALKLETRRSDAAEGEQPTTHEVTMTVTIPEAASAEAALSELPPEEPLTEEALPEAPQTEEVPAEETPAEEVPAEEVPAEETPAEEPPAEEPPAEEVPAEEVPAEETPAENPALKTSEGNTMEPLAEPEEAKKAELPEGPDPALPVEEKTDPVPEKDAGAREDETEPER